MADQTQQRRRAGTDGANRLGACLEQLGHARCAAGADPGRLSDTVPASARSRPQPDKPQPAVPVKKSVFPDHIVCLEDGKKLKMLKRHLKTAYNMTPEQYRERWGLGAGLSDGGAELRQAPLVARQEDRPRHQAARPASSRRPVAAAGFAGAACAADRSP